MSDIIVKVKNLSKKFEDITVLNNVSIDFEKGKIYGVIGRNGSGKTVLFKCICGFMKATSGEVLVRDKKVGHDVDIPSDLGIIIEEPGFLYNYNGYKNLKLLTALNKNISKEAIYAILEKVGLKDAKGKKVGKYSMGMRQRLGIAQAIMEDQEILILDEPMNGLDKNGVKEIRELLLQLKSEGKTIILASHNAEDINVLCDSVYEMDLGNISKIR